MSTVDLIIQTSSTFYKKLKQDENGRYRSWEHCYKQFHDARNNPDSDIDYLSLHLAFYLASWGMYRGSSFILQKDYRVHIPVIKEILNEKYDPLFGIECVELRKGENQKLLKDLIKFMKDHYRDVRLSVKETIPKNNLSDTLITKILMGTFGCVPAYDRYFTDGVKKEGVTTGNYSPKSLLKLIDFYEKNNNQLEDCRKQLNVYGLPYPQMKLLDMGFWQIGFERDTKKGLQKAH